MTYKPDYIIGLKEGRTVPLVFNSMTVLSFTEEQGIEISEVLTKFNSNQIASILRKGHESYCMYEDLPEPVISKKELMTWVDALGGFFSPKTAEVLEIFAANALGMTLKEFKKVLEINKKEGTKKEPEADSPNA
jgi:Ca2+-binding EF-hand superfamily protein